MIRRGQLHWVELDKKRPALVISHDDRNELANDVIVLPCSTSARAMSWHIELIKGEGGLAAKTSIKCEQPMTIPKAMVSRLPLGAALSAARLLQVERALLSALGILI